MVDNLCRENLNQVERRIRTVSKEVDQQRALLERLTAEGWPAGHAHGVLTSSERQLIRYLEERRQLLLRLKNGRSAPRSGGLLLRTRTG